MMVLAIALLIGAANTKSVPAPRACTDAATRDKVRLVMLDGFELALKDHVKSIFDVYLRDHADTTQRAAAGIHNGTVAYIHSRAAAMAWDPPECKP